MWWIGTSGWQYKDWKGAFYPEKLAQKSWILHYAEHFAIVEANNPFYRLPEREVFEEWARITPDDFVVASKMSRYLTHIKRLRDPGEPVSRFFSRAEGLGDKLGPVLLQLPPTLKADNELLEVALREMPRDARIAVEFRHATWFTDSTRSVLERHRAALCLTDRLNRRPEPLWRTTEWTYVRFHEGRARPAPCYGDGALGAWVERLESVAGSSDDIYVFFNNDPRGCAVANATTFAHLAMARGNRCTRVPPPISVVQ